MKRSVTYIVLLAVVAAVMLYLLFRQPHPERSKDGTLVIFNWEDYLDKGIIADFEKETGIAVTVVEYQTMDEELSRLQEDPGAFDLIISNESTIDFLQHAKLIREFDRSQLSGVELITPRFAHRMPWAVPYLWGTTGFMVDTRQVPSDIESVEALWDPKYRGKTRLLDDVREAVAPILLKGGYSFNTDDPVQIADAERHALSLRDNGISFGDTFGNVAKVADGTLWIAQTYNGDYLYKARGRSEFRFFLPREGFAVMVEYFVLPKASKNQDAAHRFVSFCLRPEIAARNSNTYFYANAVKGSEAFLRPELKDNAVMFPAESTLKRGTEYRDVGDAYAAYQRIFNAMKPTAR
ncbi:MAG TPA: spermidine/putrescine ABC transporter substrate-binding protein [bacterium]|nr:spermidine/putrescine ABC transporter substrate-binding protein [bacterium]